jgi:CubicO group peptidase (beta-lactamase class C family)
MTKAIVTTAFMMLYEEGHFLLNDPVERYLPQFKDPLVILDPETGKDGATESDGREYRVWRQEWAIFNYQ